MTKRKIKKSPRGLTMMEVMVSLAVFTTVVTIAVTIFLLANDSQQRTSSGTKMRAAVSQVTELVTREVRNSRIDYGYYAQNVVNPVSTLVLRDNSGDQKRFRFNATEGFVETCSCTENSCAGACVQSGDWSALTPPSISVTRLDFYITPRSDPFFQPRRDASCSNGSFDETVGLCTQCWPDMTLDSGYCFNANVQPKVQMVIEANNEEQGSQRDTISLQTGITTRTYER